MKRSDITVAAAPSPIVAPDTAEFTPPAEATSENDAPETAPGGPGNFGGRGGRGGFGQQMAELMKDPEFAAAVKVEQEARIEQRYGALFKQLNLNPEQLASLKTLIAEREAAGRDVWASAREQGLNPRDPAAREQLNQLANELRTEVDSNIQSKLGDSVLAALNTYNATGSQRATVNDLTQRLTYSAQPLNDSQSRMLTTILAETGTPAGRSTLITDATIARAQGVLAPAQVDALKKLQAEQQAQRLVQTKMREARERAQAARNAARQNNN